MAAASSGPPPGGTNSQPILGTNNKVDTTSTTNKPNYAAAAAAAHSESKWLHLHLHREEKSISFNLTKKEKAILLFRRFKLDPKSVISIESCDFEQIRIELKPHVDIEKLKKSTAIQIRPGLKVQPMKEMKRTTRVKVCWVKLSVPDEEIVKTLEIFGKVEGRVEHLTFDISEEESKDSDLHQLKGIKSGERAVEIELGRNIPSYVKIAGKRARIWYPGQNFTCGRCYKSFKSCPGKADRRECLRLKGKEKDFEEFWKEVIATVPRREAMAPDDKYDTDTLDLARVPEDATKQELLDWIKSKNINMEPDCLQATQFKHTWKIVEIPSEEVMSGMIARLHGAKLRNKPILALPIKMPTPTKSQNVDMEPNAPGGGDGNDNMNIDDEQTMGQEKPEEKEARLQREKEQERLQKEEDERQRRGQERSDQGLAAAGASVGQKVSAEEKGAATDDTGDSTNTRVSNNFLQNAARNLGETFGLLTKKGPINLNDNDKDNSKVKSSAQSSTSAPPQTKPQQKETGTKPKTTQQVLVEETPVPQAPVARMKFVEETPAEVNPASPKLSKSNKEEEGDKLNLTLESDDPIFDHVINITKTPTYQSEFATALKTVEQNRRRRNNTLNLNLNLNQKRNSRWLSSSDSSGPESAEKPSPEKEKSDEEDEDSKTPDRPKGPEAPLTKGQKKARKKKQKREEEKKKKIEGDLSNVQ